MKVFLLCQRGNEREFLRAECKEEFRCLMCEMLRCAAEEQFAGLADKSHARKQLQTVDIATI